MTVLPGEITLFTVDDGGGGVYTYLENIGKYHFFRQRLGWF